MSDIITTLKEKGTPTNSVYPNIVGDNIPNNAVTNTKIADGSITTNKIVDGAITTIKVNDGSITTNKIVDGAITGDKIALGSITETKISDGAITGNKIATYSISEGKIQNGSIIPSKLAFNLFAYLGSTLEFTDNGHSFVIYIPPIISTNNYSDVSYIINDIQEFISLWFSYYQDCTILTRGKKDNTWYDVIISVANEDDTTFRVRIDGELITIDSNNYQLVDLLKTTLLELR